MTIRRPRLTVRRLMAAVALAGVALGGRDLLHRRRGHALSLASRHYSKHHRMVRQALASEDHARFDRLIAYHLQLERKWREAARRPWLPFEGDPPEPELPAVQRRPVAQDWLPPDLIKHLGPIATPRSLSPPTINPR